jgi:hypothetical protein
VRACAEPARSDPAVPSGDPAAPVPRAPDTPTNVWELQPPAAEATTAAYRDHPTAVVWH